MLEMMLWSMGAVLPTLAEVAGNGKPSAPWVFQRVGRLDASRRRCPEKLCTVGNLPGVSTYNAFQICGATSDASDRRHGDKLCTVFARDAPMGTTCEWRIDLFIAALPAQVCCHQESFSLYMPEKTIKIYRRK
jgi:hypothetical protein